MRGGAPGDNRHDPPRGGHGGLQLDQHSISSYSGFQAVEASPADLKVGAETKSTVRAKLGSPSATSTFDRNVWSSISQTKQRVALRRPQVVKRDVVVLTFEKDSEQLRNLDRLSLQEGRVIAYNGRETPTRGRALTVLEQLLGSLGRGAMLPPGGPGLLGTRSGDRR